MPMEEIGAKLHALITSDVISGFNLTCGSSHVRGV
jgi:hypothetical protein